jgi:hypothetical protein
LFQRLEFFYDESPSLLAFKFNLRRYSSALLGALRRLRSVDIDNDDGADAVAVLACDAVRPRALGFLSF